MHMNLKDLSCISVTNMSTFRSSKLLCVKNVPNHTSENLKKCDFGQSSLSEQIHEV